MTFHTKLPLEKSVLVIVLHKMRIDSYNSLPMEKILTFIMLEYSLSQLLISIKIANTITYF